MKTIAIDEEHHKRINYLKIRWELDSLKATIEKMIEYCASGISNWE